MLVGQEVKIEASPPHTPIFTGCPQTPIAQLLAWTPALCATELRRGLKTGGIPCYPKSRGHPVRGILLCEARLAWHQASTPSHSQAAGQDSCQECQECRRLAVSFPLIFLPTPARTGYFLSRETRSLYGKTTGHLARYPCVWMGELGWALLGG